MAESSARSTLTRPAKAHRPYEFGVKVSIATTVARQRGGQFVLAAQALPGATYDGHTLSTVIPQVEAIVGNEIKRIITDKCMGQTRHNGSAQASPVQYYQSCLRRRKQDERG